MKHTEYRGLETLGPQDRIALVKHVFSAIGPRYDCLNRLLSLRQDVLWRRITVRGLRFFKTNRLLDIATGTADISLQALETHPGIRVAAIDLVREMLNLGKKKIVARGGKGQISLFQADALALPFLSETFDAVTVGFGIRNIPDRLAAIREMARVLVPGGRVHILETTLPEHPVIRRAYRLYLHGLLPRIAAMISPKPEAYIYLGDSIADFPSPSSFLQLMEEAGLTCVEAIPLTLGVCRLYRGTKL